jgi:KDO2-lipid IV(A) lauroyltransferase
MGLLRLITLLPWSLGKQFGRLLGRLLYQVSKRRRVIVEKNIAACFPEFDDKQQRKLVLDTFYANGMGVIETAYAWWSSLGYIAKRLDIDGLEQLQQACASDKGVLILGAHFTSPDLGCALLNQQQAFMVTYQRHNNPLMDALILRGRARCLGGAIEREQIRQVVKELKGGNTIWLAPDQDLGPDRSVFAPFFGLQTATTGIASRLAKTTQCHVFFFSHQHVSNSHYRLSLTPLSALPSGDVVEDANIINACIERAVRQYPEQYLWLHRRFKTRPEGETSIY